MVELYEITPPKERFDGRGKGLVEMLPTTLGTGYQPNKTH